MKYILLFLNGIILGYAFLASQMDSALSRGDLINNPILYVILLGISIVFLFSLNGGFEIKPTGTVIIGFLSAILLVLFLLGEFPIFNKDKIPHIVVSVVTGLYILLKSLVILVKGIISERRRIKLLYKNNFSV